MTAKATAVRRVTTEGPENPDWPSTATRAMAINEANMPR